MAIVANIHKSADRGTFSRVSNTQAQLVLGSVTLNLLTSVVGVGGLDSGSIANLTFYYVYLVNSSGTQGIIASTNAVAPSGFISCKKVGAFYTDGSANIFRAFKFNESNQIGFSVRVNGNGASVISKDPADFLAPTPVVSHGTGDQSVNFKTGFFCVIPITIIRNSDGGNFTVDKNGTDSVTVVRWRTFAAATGSPQNNTDCSLTVNRTGVEATQPDWIS